MKRQEVADAFYRVVSRLDEVLNPWEFQFSSDGVRGSHCGPFGSGYYVRGATRIGISCRATLDNVFYEHSFIKQNLCSRETEIFSIGHDTLMRALGHADDCRLITTCRQPDLVVARKFDDSVAALIHDLTRIAATVLRQPCAEFDAI